MDPKTKQTIADALLRAAVALGAAAEDEPLYTSDDFDYHRIQEGGDFHWTEGFHWTTRAKAEKVLKEGFFSPLHGFEQHETGVIYVAVLSSKAAAEVDTKVKKVDGKVDWDDFQHEVYQAAKRHHSKWNRFWYGKTPGSSDSYGDTCLRADLSALGDWIGSKGVDAVELYDNVYGNGLLVEARIPGSFFTIVD